MKNAPTVSQREQRGGGSNHTKSGRKRAGNHGKTALHSTNRLSGNHGMKPGHPHAWAKAEAIALARSGHGEMWPRGQRVHRDDEAELPLYRQMIYEARGGRQLIIDGDTDVNAIDQMLTSSRTESGETVIHDFQPQPISRANSMGAAATAVAPTVRRVASGPAISQTVHKRALSIGYDLCDLDRVMHRLGFADTDIEASWVYVYGANEVDGGREPVDDEEVVVCKNWDDEECQWRFRNGRYQWRFRNGRAAWQPLQISSESFGAYGLRGFGPRCGLWY